jgi:alpha-tubulin suppressor-like RCC1 family protein
VLGAIPTGYQTSSTTNGTSVFTPPTSPLTAISSTVLLTAQNTTIVDNSTNAFTITNNGSINYTLNTPFTYAIITGALYGLTMQAGYSITGGIDISNKLYTWGLNTFGQLGDGTTVNRNSPSLIGSLTTWSKLSVGEQHMAASLSINGNLFTWGRATGGALGLNDTIHRSSPTQVNAISLPNVYNPSLVSTSNWTNISVAKLGDFTIGKLSNSTIYSWGRAVEGALGLNDTLNRSSPTQIGTSSYAQISAGGTYATAVLADAYNTVTAWGLGTSAQLGDNTVVTKSSPIAVSAITTVTASSPVLILSGNYSSYYESSPVQIGSSSWSVISAGSNHNLGKLINNTVFAWGYNYYGQLGDSTTINRSSPVQIASGSYTNVNAGDNFSSLRKNDNTIYLFGENDVGQIGDLT